MHRTPSHDHDDGGGDAKVIVVIGPPGGREATDFYISSYSLIIRLIECHP
jgi:hypothetical protein